MAIIGEWRGDEVAILPGTSWAAPVGMFPTEARNDESAYGFDSANSTLTLPSSDLPDGYLIIAGFEFEDASNGRHNPQGRFIQTSGTGNFVAAASSGYNRDNSEDRSFVRSWAFIDNPSSGATLQFQWRRDTDAPSGGTERSQLQVLPFFYGQIGLYQSASNACPGGTTPSQITGWSAVSESDAEAIALSSDIVTLKGDNKRYLLLGSQYWQGIGSSRTQRWHGFRIDGAIDNSSRAYSYARNGSNADIGDIFSLIVDRATTDIQIDQFVFRGEPLSGFPATGANVTANVTGSNASHAMVILELNDSATLIQGRSAAGQSISGTTPVSIEVAASIDFNDAATFTRGSDTSIAVSKAADVFIGANISGGYRSSSGARYTGESHITLDGADQPYAFAGDYGRGNQGTQDTYGWSANHLASVAVTAGQSLGVSANRILGGEAGPVDALAGWSGFWAVDLDSLAPSPPPAAGNEGKLMIADGTSFGLHSAYVANGTSYLLGKVHWADGAAFNVTYPPE
ncbi:MAG: hypothetical protein AAGJ85_04385 [Pseudomonadota bacterium]